MANALRFAPYVQCISIFLFLFSVIFVFITSAVQFITVSKSLYVTEVVSSNKKSGSWSVFIPYKCFVNDIIIHSFFVFLFLFIR